ncbi:MAG: hypothetical protein AB1640_16875 [bacterium]
MKHGALVGVMTLAALGLALVAFSGQVPPEIGCTAEQAEDAIFNNLRSGSFYPPYCNRVYKAIPPDKRASVVRKLGDFAKSTVGSDAFRTRYLAEWEASRPIEPEQEAVATPASQMEGFEDQIRKTEAQIASPDTPEEQKKYLRDSIASMKEMVQQMNTPEMRQMVQQGYEMQKQEASRRYERQMEEYRKKLADWENSKDVNHVLRTRLKDFLEITKQMDFKAPLVKRGDKYVFADPALEAKDYRWKMCFRCGKEAIEAARAYASGWLDELEQP